ncbi:DUF3309 family protein [Falsiroseomonas sp.]|uniref:DUF3309 family protein n=1 Tax=Falsiroseomonas sp. TaxID=2870721 RepID=UPI003566D955
MWGFIIFLVLLALIIAALPTWPYSRRWGYGPVGGATALLVLFLLLVWFGIIAVAWPGYY